MTADLNGEGGPDPSHGQESPRDKPPLPAALVRPVSSGRNRLSANRRRRRRTIVSTLVALLVGLFSGAVSPILSQPVQNTVESIFHYFSGVDQPIELSTICKNLGGIVAPHAETDAAYKWRCARSQQTISPSQIKQMCRTEWGPKAQLVLRDPNSAAGWKCHMPGSLP
jgi:hypothetical protein